jgi:hypothetical protein
LSLDLPSPLIALAELVLDPAQALARDGFQLDSWQTTVIRTIGRPRRPGELPRRAVIVTARQAGKSITVSGAIAARLILDPGCVVVVVSASARQATEVGRHVRRFLGRVLLDTNDVVAESQTHVELANGSRLTIVAASSTSVRGWSANLLIIDEAAYLDDETVDAVLPTLAATGGDLVLASTPVAPSGRFYDLWMEAQAAPDRWQSVRVTAADCARLPASEIESMRRRLSPTRAARDLDAEFVEPAGAIVSAAALAAAFDMSGTDDGWPW